MASGRPVIAYGAGGALEAVKADETGIFFDEQSWEALADAVVRFKPEQFDPKVVRAYAEQFGIDRFKDQMRNLVTAEREKSVYEQIRCGF